MPKAVIMAGGPGERFWPLTHKTFPKYRIRLENKESLLQKTYRRLLKIYARKDIHVVTTREHWPLICKELPGLRRMNILIEPMRKNTAAAIFFSSFMLGKKYGPEEIITFFPADHLIKNEALFTRTLQHAIQTAKKDERLVTIGIQPTFPATGYGYVEMGAPISAGAESYQVRRFTEKPSRETALRYIKTKRFLWNGGIFSWRIGVFMDAMKKYAPEFQEIFDERRLSESYRRLPKLSIDYALLEKVKNLAVIKTRMDWCDMGSWDMFLEKADHDPDKNQIHGIGHHHQARNSLLINHGKVPLITWGVSDLIVVQTEQGTLICKRGYSEEAALLLKKIQWPDI